MPNSSAAERVKLMTPSETIHDTGGTLDTAVLLSLVSRSLKGPRHVVVVDSHSAGTSWVASASEGGRPSGMASKRKDGKPLRESWPLDLRRRLWLNSVLTKHEKKIMKKRIMAEEDHSQRVAMK
nr:hypothetical protein PanWU01x14_244710 [Ipomoea trifida]